MGVVTLWLCKNTKTHCLVGFSLVCFGNGGKTEASDVKMMLIYITIILVFIKLFYVYFPGFTFLNKLFELYK